MESHCPRCRHDNRAEARFCSGCGMTLDLVPGVDPRPGTIKHPGAIAPPEGFSRCGDAADLHYRWESAWGSGTFLGTEPILIKLFNAGYPLETVELAVRGADAKGDAVFDVVLSMHGLPQGRGVETEVPSYEYSTPASTVEVSLASAEFATDD